jgi:hypothetical protein
VRGSSKVEGTKRVHAVEIGLLLLKQLQLRELPGDATDAEVEVVLRDVLYGIAGGGQLLDKAEGERVLCGTEVGKVYAVVPAQMLQLREIGYHFEDRVPVADVDD